MALRADGNAPNITAFLSRESVASVSGNGGVPSLPITTKLSRSNGQQRGHAGRPDFLIELRSVGQSTQHHRLPLFDAL